MASARMAASSAFSSSQRSPVRRLVKADAKPVARFTSCSSSVMRTRGIIASIPSAKARASGVEVALTGATCRRPSREFDPVQLAPPQPSREAFQPPVEFFRLRSPAIHRPLPAGRAWLPLPARRRTATDSCRTGDSWRSARPRCRPSATCRAGSPAPPSRRAAGSVDRPSITRRRHSLRNGIGASAGTSRLPDRLRSASSFSAASIGSPARAARNSSASIRSGANLRSVLQRSAARSSGSSSARLASVLDLAAHAQQLRPADRLVDGLEGVAVVLLCRGERFDRAVEQAHQPADVAGAGGVAPARGIARLGEQAADQLVGHVQHRIRQARLEIDDRRDQDRAASACGIAAELMGVGGVALAHELPQPLLMDRGHRFRPDRPISRTRRSRSSSSRMWSALGATGIALSQANGVMLTEASTVSRRIEFGASARRRGRRAKRPSRAGGLGPGRQLRHVRSHCWAAG